MADRTPARSARQRKRRTAARVVHRAFSRKAWQAHCERRDALFRGFDAGYCERCHDGDGGCVFPFYGVAPHLHATGPIIGSTRLLPPDQWPANFEPDAEYNGCGTYTHCLHCGAGL